MQRILENTLEVSTIVPDDVKLNACHLEHIYTGKIFHINSKKKNLEIPSLISDPVTTGYDNSE